MLPRMGKIYCIMGKSGTGKDTLFRRLMADPSLGLKPFITYTTRPMREGEREGVEYHFIDEKALARFEQERKVIERREYHTVKGLWIYCTIDDGGIDLEKGSYLTIVTLQAYDSFRSYFGPDAVVPLYIDVDDGIRLERALHRERKRTHPEYEEMCRRFLADNQDFSPERLRTIGIIDIYINEELSDCVQKLRQSILNEG